MTTPPPDPVLVIGGGWAGLAAAVELAKHRIPVQLIEAAKQLGGRARGVRFHGQRLDNGQHLLLGAYESTLDLLRVIGIREEDVLERRPLALHLLRGNGRHVRLRTSALPAPLHLAWALATLQGLGLRDRLSALRFSRALKGMDFALAEDESVQSLLHRHGQSPALVEALWEPLCLGALNTHIHEASAQVFLRTLGDSFQYARRDSDLLLTRVNLGRLLPEPALDYIERHAGSVRFGQRVTALTLADDTVRGVDTGAGSIAASQVILATAAPATQTLIAGHTALRPLAAQLAHLSHRPICTVYLQYHDTVRLEAPLCGSLGTLSQWIFDRRIYDQAGLMAVVISGDGEHLSWDNTRLCDHVEGELAGHFPHWPKPQARHIIREKRATIASTVGVNAHRPGNATPCRGLWLAGDYTDTGLPATLEGAVRSGLSCARAVIQQRQENNRKTA